MKQNNQVNSPREIANERLARSEIDIKEHSQIIELLESSEKKSKSTVSTSERSEAPSSETIVTPTNSRAVTATLPRQSHAWLWWLFGIIGLFILLVIIGMNESNIGTSGGLTIGQLKHKRYTSGNKISLTIANTSQESGDVVLFIDSDGIKTCEHIMEMRPGRIDDVTFKCEMAIAEGAKFHVYVGWSTDLPQMAAIAKRISVNWNKN